MNFPEDDNGDVLRRMQSRGDDLSKSREIDFSVIFSNEESANYFAAEVCSQECKVAVERTSTVPELPWDVCVSRSMVPTYEGISAFEEHLGAIAERYGGRNDGWGCFNQPFQN